MPAAKWANDSRRNACRPEVGTIFQVSPDQSIMCASPPPPPPPPPPPYLWTTRCGRSTTVWSRRCRRMPARWWLAREDSHQPVEGSPGQEPRHEKGRGTRSPAHSTKIRCFFFTPERLSPVYRAGPPVWNRKGVTRSLKPMPAAVSRTDHSEHQVGLDHVSERRRTGTTVLTHGRAWQC